jgi:tetratricopeptide (TPR) repeat protein
MTLFPGTALYDDFQRQNKVGEDIWLQRIEDLLYFETDPGLDKNTILAFGKKLRGTYFQWLADFALEAAGLEDFKSSEYQADFLSRLGLTFSHGDYARLTEGPDPQETACALFRRALDLHPDHRAYWGLALIHQQRNAWVEAGPVLHQGLEQYPDSRDLNICMGRNLIHQGHFQQALEHLLPFDQDRQTWPLLVRCYQALGLIDKAAALARSMEDQQQID